MKSEGESGRGKRKEAKRSNITFTMLEGKGEGAGKKGGIRKGMGRPKNTISKTEGKKSC